MKYVSLGPNCLPAMLFKNLYIKKKLYLLIGVKTPYQLSHTALKLILNIFLILMKN